MISLVVFNESWKITFVFLKIIEIKLMIKEKEIKLRINKKREYKNHKIKNKKEIKKRNLLLVFLLGQCYI